MAEDNDDDPLKPAAQPEIEEDSEDSSERPGRTTTDLTVRRLEFEFSGPLPPPHLLKDYNDAFAGCAERVVAMAERQSAHRQHLEKTVVEGNLAAQSRGQ